MTQEDIAALEVWLVICGVIAAICTTAFPVFYSFLRWRQTWVGKALMLQGLAFAAAMDLTILFWFLPPESIVLQFWVTFVGYTFIAISTALVTGVLIRTNLQNRSDKKLDRKKEQHVR